MKGFLLVDIESVTCRAHRADQVRHPRQVHGFAQAADMHINCSEFDVAVHAPDRIEQTLPREDAARMFQKVAEKAKFRRPKLEQIACSPRFVRDNIELKIAIGKRLSSQGRAHAAQDSSDPCNQFTRRKWLGDIIVCTSFEAADPGGLIPRSGNEREAHVGVG